MQNFFLKTLNIGHGLIHSAVAKLGEAGTFTGKDMRGKHTPITKTTEEAPEIVRRHIESFPKIESHYTHSNTQRLY